MLVTNLLAIALDAVSTVSRLLLGSVLLAGLGIILAVSVIVTEIVSRYTLFLIG